MVASGHLCREDCQEGGHSSQRGGDTVQCHSQGPRGHRKGSVSLQKDENGGEKQGGEKDLGRERKEGI